MIEDLEYRVVLKLETQVGDMICIYALHTTRTICTEVHTRGRVQVQRIAVQSIIYYYIKMTPFSMVYTVVTRV